jgi:Fic family protein
MRRLVAKIKILCYIVKKEGKTFMYIYEMEKWPNFSWDQKKISSSLSQLRYEQGHLLGEMESIGFEIQQHTILKILTKEIIKSSEIEGEILNEEQVRSSVARHLGMDIAGLLPTDKNIDGVVEMVLDATQKFDKPLTKKRILQWHTLLFPSGRSGFSKITTGKWRKGPVEVVSGHWGKETIHFEAPKAERIEYEMKLFLNWINEKPLMDPIIKAAIAHIWFVTIHPFDDGNGRIGRAIVDFLLAKAENTSKRFYSLSAQIQKERKNYYDILEKTQKGSLNITAWIDWFIGSLERAIKNASSIYETVLQKAKFWDSCKEILINSRQKKIINKLLEGFEGNLTSSKWANIAKCSQDTAYRDIVDLLNRGILIKNEKGGRSTSYTLANFKNQKLSK